jgi:SnoaL-like domain
VELAFVAALQRARKAVRQRVPETTQHAELAAIGVRGQRELVDAFMRAWERADVAALVELLAKDARFTMPPLPTWFQGQADIGRFFADRMFPTPWRLATASGWPGSTCWPFAQVGSPGSPAASTLICIVVSGCPRNCLEATPARSDEFRRGRVSQCSEQRQRSDPERGRS